MKYLITGGTGSLGKALVKRLLEQGQHVIVYSRDEGKQALAFGHLRDVIDCVIGDVRDREKLLTTMRIMKPDVVIHAAALKRVDDMELYPDECIKTNIHGSENVAVACLRNNVERCILVSTDKSCTPINVYGASKFIAERLFTNFDYLSRYEEIGRGAYRSKRTIFSSVRYGNVIASRGSFVPMWMDAIKDGRDILVTSFDCSRFLFPLSAAVDTVLRAVELMEGGEVFVPLIKSFRMQAIIDALTDLCEVEHIGIKIIGMRPGEKIHEDMLAKTELEFTRKTDGIPELLVILPQYTNRIHREYLPYDGLELNTAWCLSDDIEYLKSLIVKGLQDAE